MMWTPFLLFKANCLRKVIIRKKLLEKEFNFVELIIYESPPRVVGRPDFDVAQCGMVKIYIFRIIPPTF